MSDHYSIVHYLYQLFYQKMYGNDDYVFNPSEQALKQINKFLVLLNERYKLETIGVNFLITYFVFQFDYWNKCEIKEKTNWSNRIQLTGIIGDKAFVRWNTRDINFDWTMYQSEFLRKYKIITREIKDFFKEEKTLITNIAEELEKKRFYQTDRGFLNCIQTTTLYNHHSKLCILCKSKVDCKTMLKTNYPKIYEIRGY